MYQKATQEIDGAIKSYIQRMEKLAIPKTIPVKLENSGHKIGAQNFFFFSGAPQELLQSMCETINPQ